MIEYNEVNYWANRLKNSGNINTTTTSGGLSAIERDLIKKYITPYSEVLDYGIGGGRTIPLYKELHLKATGFDIADFSEIINAKLAELPEKYEFFQYVFIPAVGKLPYPDLTFDYVVSFSVLTHCKPSNVRLVLNEITRLGKLAIISAYDDIPLKITPDNYCFLHDYNAIFKEMGIIVIETDKVDKIRFWVIKKQ